MTGPAPRKLRLSRGGRPRKTGNTASPVSDTFTLKQVGMSKRQSSDWQWIARIPEAEFEALLSAGVRTTAALVRYAKRRTADLSASCREFLRP